MTMIRLAGTLLFEPLDQEWAVYHRETRETHVVDGLGADLLQFLQAAPRSRDELVMHLVGSHPGAGTEEAARYIDDLLEHWNDSGLVA